MSYIPNFSAIANGSGTNYTLTTSLARVDFGTTDPEVVLPTAGTYFVMANYITTASALSAADFHFAVLRNSTDSVFFGSGSGMSLGASFNGNGTVSGIITITASKTIQLWAVNFTAARGEINSDTSIKYIRLY